MIEIKTFEDITQILLSREIGGKPLYWVAAYLVDGLLIDTGCSYTVQDLVSFLERNPPKLAVNTHYHEDHIAANSFIQERFGIPIYAPPASIPFIGRPATLFPYQEMTWGYPEPSTVLPISPIVRTNRFTFEVIETPGHSQDHVVLVERSRGWCFSGDIFVGQKVKAIRLEEDMAATLDSLRKLAALKMKRLVLLTSLGRIFENGQEALEGFERFIVDLSRKAKALQAQGRSIPEIVAELFGGEDPLAPLTNGQFTSENLIRSILRMR